MRFHSLKQTRHPCGYFDDRQALFEHYIVHQSNDQERELLLATGYRSFGKYLFRPHCGHCQRCVPLRVPVASFEPNKSQRRVLKKCTGVHLEVGTPQFSEEKFELYLDHQSRFPHQETPSSKEHFIFSFYDTEVPSLEFCYFMDNTLIAVGIVHETPTALSSVYFTYRNDVSHLSLGTYSVLKEIEFAREKGKTFLYLGYWIRDNHFMKYKGSFYPNEVLLGDEGWSAFRDAQGHYLLPSDITFSPFPIF